VSLSRSSLLDSSPRHYADTRTSTRQLLQSLALNSALTSVLREPDLPTHLATPNELSRFNNRNRRGPSLQQIKEVKLEHANSPIDKRNFLVHEAYDRYFMALNGMYFKEYRHRY